MGACAKPVSQKDYAAGPMSTQAEPVSNVSSYFPQMENAVLPRTLFGGGALAGRTLEVASTSDIILKPGEVILTFDDGPRPGKTDAILDILDAHGVKATFLMLGSQARAHPQLARQVALRGNTIGSHTYDHRDLSKLTRQAALDEIAKGENAIAEVLQGSGQALSPFFRFPYLAQTGFLRTSMLQGNIVVLDVDIDSKDYYKDSAATVEQRTLDRLATRGSGIILFHDIHQRTVDMLPDFLDTLEARGYKVVSLAPRYPGIFGRSVITANAPLSTPGL